MIKALKDFKLGNKLVAVVTSVSTWCLDIRVLELVVDDNLQREIDNYIHRMERTGQVGNTSKTISFYDSKEASGLTSVLVVNLTELHKKLQIIQIPNKTKTSIILNLNHTVSFLTNI